MTLIVILFFIVCLSEIRIADFHDDYLSIPKTTSIKGIFVVLILLSHVRGYGVFNMSNLGDLFLTLLGQMIVVMYFFYSGYGINKQYKKKGNDYIRYFPVKRILKTLIHFDVAVLLFIFLQLVLGEYYHFYDYLLALIGWTSVGNSNWFVFDILVLYFFTWIIFRFCARFSHSNRIIIILITILTIVFWIFLYIYRGSQQWWMNTILAFPLGVWYSNEEVRINCLFKKYSFLAFIPISIWFLWRFFVGIDVFGISAILFALGVVGITTKFSVDNKALRWLGSNCFEIYIIQRLPMIFLYSFGLQKYDYLFTLAVIILSFTLALFLHRVLLFLDSHLGLS